MEVMWNIWLLAVAVAVAAVVVIEVVVEAALGGSLPATLASVPEPITLRSAAEVAEAQLQRTRRAQEAMVALHPSIHLRLVAVLVVVDMVRLDAREQALAVRRSAAAVAVRDEMPEPASKERQEVLLATAPHRLTVLAGRLMVMVTLRPVVVVVLEEMVMTVMTIIVRALLERFRREALGNLPVSQARQIGMRVAVAEPGSGELSLP
jgi:hypothetical protein